jgi:hypothetical protein
VNGPATIIPLKKSRPTWGSDVASIEWCACAAAQLVPDIRFSIHRLVHFITSRIRVCVCLDTISLRHGVFMAPHGTATVFIPSHWCLQLCNKRFLSSSSTGAKAEAWYLLIRADACLLLSLWCSCVTVPVSVSVWSRGQSDKIWRIDLQGDHESCHLVGSRMTSKSGHLVKYGLRILRMTPKILSSCHPVGQPDIMT